MHGRGRATAAAAVFCLAASGFTAISTAQAVTVTPSGPAAAARADSATEVMAAEYASTFGVSATVARQRLLAQKKSIDTAADLDKRLGSAAQGMWIDQNSGELHVNVRDDVAAATVRSSNGVPHQVGTKLTELQSLMRQFDTAAAKGAPAGVHMWYVDIEKGTVVVSATEKTGGLTKGRFAELVHGASDRVRVEKHAGTQQDAASVALGGQDIYNANGKRCSIGFNVRSSRGAQAVLTAGHCMQGNTSPLWFRNGVPFGNTTGYANGSQDHALITNALPGFWVPKAGVDFIGFTMPVTGRQNAVPGAFICKSGRTTNVTCGVVKAVNVSASTAAGTKIGQVEADMCVEPGDSGGAVFAGTQALGLVTAGRFYGADNKCGQKVGKKNSSLYQPLGPALSAYGASLLTTD
ncbi:S1 family peptidase [Streptomyces sp. NPDC087908]|uniref:S1 family peptidase n=1 Tax=Streptomyces sp. NPDC087908 TaxID=3365820 RepID=UPI0037FD20F7